MIYGLDFGTTNSAVSFKDNAGVRVLDIEESGPIKNLLRSVLFFDEDMNVSIGQEAIDRYSSEFLSGRYMQSVKAFLPDKSFESTEVFGRIFRIEDLIAIILRTIKNRADKIVGQNVKKVVLGRPVVFSPDSECDQLAQSRLKMAAEKAGFTDIQFRFEPIAAAFTFEQTLSPREKKLVLIGDFGGGTSDFAILKLSGGKSPLIEERRDDILGVGGVYIGGDTFDSRIMWEKVTPYFGRDVRIRFAMNSESHGMPPFINKLCHWHLIPQLHDYRIRESIRKMKVLADRPDLLDNLEDLIDGNYGLILFRTIEKAKCDLSEKELAEIYYKEFKFCIQEHLTRSEFEQLIFNDVVQIQTCVENLLADAGLEASDIDQVFLTGGSSNIPMIKWLFAEIFGLDKLAQADAFTSVVYGLGLSA